MIDAALVFKLADSISAPLRALVILAGFVGLRTGELLGLRRCDIDLEGQPLRDTRPVRSRRTRRTSQRHATGAQRNRSLIVQISRPRTEKPARRRRGRATRRRAGRWERGARSERQVESQGVVDFHQLGRCECAESSADAFDGN